MQCPVCGNDCVSQAGDLIATLPDVFSGCSSCRATVLDKSRPPPAGPPAEPCECQKRFIDQVFSHLYTILVEEGKFTGKEPLGAVGIPLIHPGFFMNSPPFLPPGSLVLVTRVADTKIAARMEKEVPEIRGVVGGGNFVPGVADPERTQTPRTYTLLAGCDVRADVFRTTAGPVVTYKQQSRIHIEFPREFNPKIANVEERIRAARPEVFVDASSGVGTLGLTAGRMKVPHLIFNDIWYAAAFWTAFNLSVNKEFLDLDEIRILKHYEAIEKTPVLDGPEKIAEATGKQVVEVYQGDYALLPKVVPEGRVLTVLDLFEKQDRVRVDRALQRWKEHASGEVFIP
ncbi:hypothetical protein J2741_001122 [Methanolinea mesophila]|uniref:hypothetical protein n=1 Tax=Methanolinea mesophila TaxID=547055 RepID=UPI001AE9E197|nr:hypothetical protein [Methanolinea mesophila]MBP1928575.1 hypothetical protein [Methanolinea mesophila]